MQLFTLIFTHQLSNEEHVVKAQFSRSIPVRRRTQNNGENCVKALLLELVFFFFRTACTSHRAVKHHTSAASRAAWVSASNTTVIKQCSWKCGRGKRRKSRRRRRKGGEIKLANKPNYPRNWPGTSKWKWNETRSAACDGKLCPNQKVENGQKQIRKEENKHFSCYTSFFAFISCLNICESPPV